jgi:hypothetical protein
MRVELPNDHWVEVRDRLKARDKVEVHRAVTFTIGGSGGSQEVSAVIQDEMRQAFLAQIITSWSYTEREGWPIPANNPGGSGILGELDLDEYNALSLGIEDLFQKVSFSGGSSPN